MAQYVFTMSQVAKLVPPKRHILRDISLSFFPGAKIGVLGLNGSGKSTLLRIMAGIDKEFDGEARPQPGIRIGYLEQEPELDANKSVREIGVLTSLCAVGVFTFRSASLGTARPRPTNISSASRLVFPFDDAG